MVIKDFRVSDMICANCAMRLQGLEDDLPGVVEVRTSYRTQIMSVKFDRNRINESQIIEAVRMLGYTAKPCELES